MQRPRRSYRPYFRVPLWPSGGWCARIVAADRVRKLWFPGTVRLDPMECTRRGGHMRMVAFIEPPQGAVIKKTLCHCGLR